MLQSKSVVVRSPAIRPFWTRPPERFARDTHEFPWRITHVHSLTQYLIKFSNNTINAGLDSLFQDHLMLLDGDLHGPDGPTGVLIQEVLHAAVMLLSRRLPLLLCTLLSDSKKMIVATLGSIFS
jgi:hypothetical protein